MAARAMHLAERRRRRRHRARSSRNCFSQSGPSSAIMRRLTKAQPIGGASALQLRQLGGVFRRQRVGNGGDELRHLHDRALQAAERGRKLHRVAAAVEIEAEQPRARDARGNAADIGADPRVARGAGGEAVAFGVGSLMARDNTAGRPKRGRHDAVSRRDHDEVADQAGVAASTLRQGLEGAAVFFHGLMPIA